MSFPTTPTNGQQATVNGIVYNYNSAKGAWIKTVTTANTLTAASLVITSNTASTSTTNGALIVAGGVGVTGNINAGSAGSQHTITGNVGIGTLGSADGAALTITRVVSGNDYRADLLLSSRGGGLFAFNSNTSAGSFSPLAQTRDAQIYYSNGTVDTGALTVGQWSNSLRGFRIDSTGVFEHASAGNVVVAATTTSTSSTTGALVVRGGAGIGGDIYDSKGEIRELVQNNQTTTYNLVATDHGKLITTTANITINTGIFTVGENVTIYNNSGSSISIVQGASVTLRLAGSATTGTRTLAQRGLATVICVAANEYVASGAGIA